MDMTLSKRADYVLRSAIALARSHEQGAPRKIRELVAATEVPRTFASQILADLVRAGLALSRAGREGGYWLARPPAQISVLELIEAAEGPLRPARCALGEGPCRWDAVCPLHESWSEATTRLTELLATTSLAELAARGEAMEAGDVAPVDADWVALRSVGVAEDAEVEVAAGPLRRALAVRASRLGPLVGAAWRDVAGAHVELPAGPGRVAALTAACSLAPVAEDTGAGAVGGEAVDEGGARATGAGVADPTFALTWRLSGPGGASHFEGALAVLEAAGGHAKVRISGVWHQDADDGVPLSGAELEGLAAAVVRAVLQRLGRSLATPAGANQAGVAEPV